MSFTPEMDAAIEEMFTKGFEEAQARELKREPVLVLFEQVLRASGDEREELKLQLAECLAADVWEATRRHRDKYDRAGMRALALEVTGTRYTEDDGFHWYHGDFVDVHAWQGHFGIIGDVMAMKDVPPQAMVPRNEAGLKSMVEWHEKHMTSTP